jgi:hypothetical protein
MRQILFRFSGVKIVPSFTSSMIMMLLAPPNEAEKRLWILMYSCDCGSRSPKLVTRRSCDPQ